MKHAVVFTGYIDWEPVITHASSRVYCYITNDYGYITLPCDIYGTTTSPNQGGKTSVWLFHASFVGDVWGTITGSQSMHE